MGLIRQDMPTPDKYESGDMPVTSATCSEAGLWVMHSQLERDEDRHAQQIGSQDEVNRHISP